MKRKRSEPSTSTILLPTQIIRGCQGYGDRRYVPPVLPGSAGNIHCETGTVIDRKETVDQPANRAVAGNGDIQTSSVMVNEELQYPMPETASVPVKTTATWHCSWPD